MNMQPNWSVVNTVYNMVCICVCLCVHAHRPKIDLFILLWHYTDQTTMYLSPALTSFSTSETDSFNGNTALFVSVLYLIVSFPSDENCNKNKNHSIIQQCLHYKHKLVMCYITTT